MLWGRQKNRDNCIRHKKRRKDKHMRMSLEQQLDGMVTVCINTEKPSPVLSLLSGHQIRLYHVDAEEDMLEITIDLDDFKRTQHVIKNK